MKMLKDQLQYLFFMRSNYLPFPEGRVDFCGAKRRDERDALSLCSLYCIILHIFSILCKKYYLLEKSQKPVPLATKICVRIYLNLSYRFH